MPSMPRSRERRVLFVSPPLRHVRRAIASTALWRRRRRPSRRCTACGPRREPRIWAVRASSPCRVSSATKSSAGSAPTRGALYGRRRETETKTKSSTGRRVHRSAQDRPARTVGRDACDESERGGGGKDEEDESTRHASRPSWRWRTSSLDVLPGVVVGLQAAGVAMATGRGYDGTGTSIGRRGSRPRRVVLPQLRARRGCRGGEAMSGEVAGVGSVPSERRRKRRSVCRRRTTHAVDRVQHEDTFDIFFHARGTTTAGLAGACRVRSPAPPSRRAPRTGP